MSIPYTIEVISTPEELPALEKDWDRLSEFSNCPNVFMTYGWFSAWISRAIHEQPGVRPHILVLKVRDEVVGVAPLICRRQSRFGFHVRKLEFATIYSDYNDLVVGEDQADLIVAVVNFLVRTADQWEFLDLRDLRNPGKSLIEIENALLRTNLHYRCFPEADRCPYMAIDAPISETTAKRLDFARYASRKFAGKASEGYRVRIVDDPQHDPGLLEKLVALEAQRQVDGQQTSFLFLDKYSGVIQSLLHTLAPSGWIKLILVEWNDRVIAYLFLYRCGKALWDYQTAFDREFSSLSLGTVLICAAVDFAFTNGLHEFDFLRGEESYKLRWTSSFRQNYRLLIWNRRWPSRISAFVYRKRRGLSVNALAARAPHESAS